jgi:hypothetical protein
MPDSFLAYREVHAVILANGDDKPIWMTEASWRTTSAVCPAGYWKGKKPEGVSEEAQATYLTQAYHCLAQDPYVQVALWFPLQDEGPVLSGLLRANGTHKPAFDAMRAYATQGDQLTEPCGNFTGPKITVASPGNQQSYNGPLPIHIRASDPRGVWRIRLEWDGKLIRNFDNTNYPTTLSGLIDWQGARHIPRGWHRLTFSAYDKQHTGSSVSVMVFHGAKGRAHHFPGKSGAPAGGKSGAAAGGKLAGAATTARPNPARPSTAGTRSTRRRRFATASITSADR